jgi:predicted nucleotidyltransferase
MEQPARRTSLERRLLRAIARLDEAHGRRLAEELGADSGAVARCLVRLEERGLLASRWLGRTRLYHAAHGLSEGDQLVQESIRRLTSTEGVSALVILPFGSRATGEARPDSDVDLAVVVPEDQPLGEAWQAFRAALHDLPVAVDLVVYPEGEARRWARIPGNPMYEAVQLNRGASRVLG